MAENERPSVANMYRRIGLLWADANEGWSFSQIAKAIRANLPEE
jgi:hypothetical protein